MNKASPSSSSSLNGGARAQPDAVQAALPSGAAGRLLIPLALTQFIASYGGSNMNVAISNIADDLGTTTHGVQIAITLFTLTMAALMIPGSKLTDIWGRKRCFALGLIIYSLGALVALLSRHLATLVVGYSIMGGIGSALMIPPVYILLTVVFVDVESRAKAFATVSAAAGLGAAAGPLIGGMITSAVSWRASFLVQVLVIAGILVVTRRYPSGALPTPKPTFDITGAVLSALGLVFVVLGILQSGTYGWVTAKQDVTIGDTVLISKGGISPVWPLVGIGAIFLLLFFRHIRVAERVGKQPLLSTRLFRNRTSNLGLVTQNIQWLTLQGSFFVVSVFLQTVRGYNAVNTGLVLTASTVGILASSAVAGRLARRFSQVLLIRAGFVVTAIGVVLLLLLADATSPIWTFLPGLFLMGIGIGVMLTSSVNVVQSSWPESDQGEISGLSRSISNLGSSLGTALVGSVLVSTAFPKHPNGVYAAALVVMGVFTLAGLGAALFIRKPVAEPQ
jgi:MFS family permease